jgi:predicted MFS family arabinose efflux permease
MLPRMAGMRGSIAVLGERDYRQLFAGRTISLIGDGMAPVALAFAILGLTGSATDLGIVLAAHSLLITALILAGGVFADRVSPRLAMVRADLVRMVAMGLIAALLIAGVAEIWELAILYAVEGAATAFFNPASNAVVPAVVSSERLQEANALLDVSRSLGKIVGPALAGILLALGTPGWALAVDAATFGASAFFLLRMRAPRRAPDGEPDFFAELRHGWREFISRGWLWPIVLSAAFTNAIFFPAFQVLGPTVAESSLGGSSAWALIAAAVGVGSLAGGALALGVRPRRPLLAGEGVLLLMALPIALLALPAVAVAIAAGALASGLSLSLAQVLYETTAIEQIPPESLSRVSAYDWFGSLALEPLGLALVGPVAAGIGISTTLWISAGVITVAQVAVLSVPAVRRVERRPGPAPQPPPPRPIEVGD